MTIEQQSNMEAGQLSGRAAASHALSSEYITTMLNETRGGGSPSRDDSRLQTQTVPDGDRGSSATIEQTPGSNVPSDISNNRGGPGGGGGYRSDMDPTGTRAADGTISGGRNRTNSDADPSGTRSVDGATDRAGRNVNDQRRSSGGTAPGGNNESFGVGPNPNDGNSRYQKPVWSEKGKEFGPSQNNTNEAPKEKHGGPGKGQKGEGEFDPKHGSKDGTIKDKFPDKNDPDGKGGFHAPGERDLSDLDCLPQEYSKQTPSTYDPNSKPDAQWENKMRQIKAEQGHVGDDRAHSQTLDTDVTKLWEDVTKGKSKGQGSGSPAPHSVPDMRQEQRRYY